MRSTFFLACLILVYNLPGTLAQPYEIDATNVTSKIVSGHLKMGNPGPVGNRILVNNKYLTLHEKPIIPVMGEFHFSRFNCDKWEDIILKMKANGINIIATYVFWIHHEEEKGIFEWSGNKDLRAFVQLCKKHGLWAYPRIGPWCHGEVRNGGLPDWIVSQDDFVIRTNNPKYQFYAERWYKEIASQLTGLYYKDNGPVIGIQLENEYWRGKRGEEHILWLKNTALKYGMDVPLYTVTGWRNASVPEKEVIPLWGGYPAAPWNTNVDKIETNTSFDFQKPVNDESIGHKNTNEKYRPDYSFYPYFTCELGVGNQISEHRRPVINPLDGLAIVTASIASGSNLPGYYVFAGGSNPVGKYTTLEEDRLESGYWNEYPDISYDFQAAIRETGEIALSYHKLKALHYFLNEFGYLLAPMAPIVPEDNNGTDKIQYAFRHSKKSGFLFVSNYYRGQKKSVKEGVRFSIKLKNESITVPSKGIQMKDSTVFIWPINLAMGNTQLKYATVQLICNLDNQDTQDWYFFESEGIAPELLFSGENIESITVNKIPVEKNGQRYLVRSVKPGLESPVIIREPGNTIHRIFILSKEQAEQFWHFNENGNEYAFLSDANLYLNEHQQIIAFSTNQKCAIIPLNCQLSPINKNKNNATISEFKKFIIHNQEEKIKCNFRQADLIDNVKWLKLTADEYNNSKKLYHRQFFKEFNMENTAEIRKATFYLITEEACKIRINGKWLNQKIFQDSASILDFTGYLQKGHNKLLFDFPLIKEEKVFSGILEIEYYNAQKDYIPTDSSWLSTEQYKIPALWDDFKGLKQAVTVKKPYQFEKLRLTPYRFIVPIDTNKIKRYKNVYLRIKYYGDKGQCRLNGKLVADNFNNGTTWSVNLSNLEIKEGPHLVFELAPFGQNQLVYFDKQPVMNNTGINSIRIEPEYSTILLVNSNK